MTTDPNPTPPQREPASVEEHAAQLYASVSLSAAIEATRARDRAKMLEGARRAQSRCIEWLWHYGFNQAAREMEQSLDPAAVLGDGEGESNG